MKKKSLILCAVLLALPTGCGRSANEGVAVGPGGEKLLVNVKEKLSLAQGEAKKFSVAVQREKIEGAVQIDYSNLPTGVSISSEKGTTIPEDKNDLILTLKVADDAPPTKEVAIKFTASAGQLKSYS